MSKGKIFFRTTTYAGWNQWLYCKCPNRIESVYDLYRTMKAIGVRVERFSNTRFLTYKGRRVCYRGCVRFTDPRGVLKRDKIEVMWYRKDRWPYYDDSLEIYFHEVCHVMLDAMNLEQDEDLCDYFADVAMKLIKQHKCLQNSQ